MKKDLIKRTISLILSFLLLLSTAFANTSQIAADTLQDVGDTVQSETDIIDDSEGVIMDELTDNSSAADTQTQITTQNDTANTENTVNTETKFAYEFTDMKVNVVVEKPESLPVGVSLQVIPIVDQSKLDTDKQNAQIQNNYDLFKTLFENQKTEKKISMAEYLSYEITFVKDNMTYQPEGAVFITIDFTNGVSFQKLEKDGSNLGVFYVDNQTDTTKVQLPQIATEKQRILLSDTQDKVVEVYFETTNFTRFAIGTWEKVEETTVEKEETTKEETTETTKVNTEKKFTFEFTDMTVEAILDEPKSLPDGVTMKVTPISDQSSALTPDADVQNIYNSFRTLFDKQASEDEINMFEYLGYQISFVKDDKEYTPTGKVSLNLIFKEGLVLSNMLEDTSNVGVYYINSEDALAQIAEKQKKVTLNGDKNRIESISFDATDEWFFMVGTNNDSPMEYKYEDNTLTAAVTVDKIDPDLFGAELTVTPIENGDKYEETQKLLEEDAANHESEVGEFLLYDITFTKEGQEVEPSRQVNVALDFKKAVKPDGVEAESVTLSHVKENSNGSTTLENLDTANVAITSDVKVENVEFAVDSFSTFVLQWSTLAQVTVHSVYQDFWGEWQEIGTSTITKNLSTGTSYTTAEFAQSIEGYMYSKARMESNTGTVITNIRVNDGGKLEYKEDSSSDNWSKWKEDKELYLVYSIENILCNTKNVEGKNSYFDVYNNIAQASSTDVKQAVKYNIYVRATEEEEYAYKDVYTRNYLKNSRLAFYIDPNGKYTLSDIKIGTAQNAGISYENKKTNLPIELNQNKTIYVNVYLTTVAKLPTVETLDTSDAIKINMFNYKTAAAGVSLGAAGEYLQGNVKQGLLSKTLDANGIPTTVKGVSLAPCFSTTDNSENYVGTATNLFLKSYYENTGYYHYSSFENFAQYDTTAEKFTVYDVLGTPSNGGEFFYKRGNFMPFDYIEPGKLSTNKNIKNEDGGDLSTTNSEYGKDLYLTTDGNGKNRTTYLFGMTLEADFIQPEEGMVDSGNNSEEMVFKFNGDDDMWVFIDGVLVLDLGGIHDAHSGSINFNTGEVIVNDCKRNETSTIELKTSIKEAYEAAGVSTEFVEVQQGDSTIYRFKDYTKHTFKMFYMERGKYASNLKVEFNIPTVPDKSVTVEKKITETNMASYMDADFSFKMYGDNQGDKNYSVLANRTYEKIQGTTSLGIFTTASDGTFTLKHNQKALFKDISATTNYYVTEYNVDSDKYDKVTINGATIETNSSVDGKPYDVGSMTDSDTVGNRPLITFGNQCNAFNYQNLIIEKVLKAGQTSNEEYTINLKFGSGAEDTWIPYTGDYYIFTGTWDPNQIILGNGKKTAENGRIILKANEKAIILGVLSDSVYHIDETNLSDGYETEKYDVKTYTNANATEGEKIKSTETLDAVSGTISLSESAILVTVRNEQKRTKLTLTKTIDTLAEQNGDAIFTFRITYPDGSVHYHTFRFTTISGKTQSYTISDLPYGTYYVEELNSLRYTLQGENNRNIVCITPEGNETTFENTRTYEKNYSHTDVVVNKFKVDANGNLVQESANQDTLGKAS